MRDYAWLLFGAAAAILVPALGLATPVGGAIAGALPLPSGAVAAGAAIFAAAAALHFRRQLIDSLHQRRRDIERRGAASRLIAEAVGDGRRWLRVIQENLELVEGGGQREADEKLYMGGARAHADKLEQALERIEGNRRQLDESSRHVLGTEH